MDVTPVVPRGKQVITSYGGGKFVINGETYTTNVLVFPDRSVQWVIGANQQPSLDNLGVVLEEEGEIDLLLIGCPKPMQTLPAQVRSGLKDVGINLEVMDTGAAVRTYNVLLAEGRRVAAALLVV